jgi:DNA-binding GntR family transcriptional regulator
MASHNTQLDQKVDYHEADPILAEIDNLIATMAARIERQREYVRSMHSDFESSIKAIADLDKMTSALDRLERQRSRMVRWREEVLRNQ